jgi:hypothetical protein
MTGYHYTSYENWIKIQKDGLVPYKIKKLELLEYFDKFPKAVWVWEKKQNATGHAGTLIFQASSKGTFKVVLLRVKYTDADLLYYKDLRVTLPHFGDLTPVTQEGEKNSNRLIYHDGEIGLLVKNTIPPEKIELVKVYDLEKLLQ